MPAPPPTSPWLYLGFTAGVLALAGAELLLSARRPGPPTVRRAAIWSAVWVGAALGFGGWLGHVRGHEDALAYGAAYLTEESLSLDNMIVFVTIFAYFGIPAAFQQRVLLWGILGAIVMRGAIIAAGAALLARAEWITYLFGAFVLVVGLRLLRPRSATREKGGSLLPLVARFIPVTERCQDASFVRRVDGRLAVTPLLVALIVIELSDVVFAVDSLPAVFGVTRDPFLVYTSNLLAVLGLRSLYFIVAGMLPRLRYLRYGVAAVLVFVGVKMLAGNFLQLSAGLSLGVIVLAIGSAAAASLLSEGSGAATPP